MSEALEISLAHDTGYSGGPASVAAEVLPEWARLVLPQNDSSRSVAALWFFEQEPRPALARFFAGTRARGETALVFCALTHGRAVRVLGEKFQTASDAGGPPARLDPESDPSSSFSTSGVGPRRRSLRRPCLPFYGRETHQGRVAWPSGSVAWVERFERWLCCSPR